MQSDRRNGHRAARVYHRDAYTLDLTTSTIAWPLRATGRATVAPRSHATGARCLAAVARVPRVACALAALCALADTATLGAAAYTCYVMATTATTAGGGGQVSPAWPIVELAAACALLFVVKVLFYYSRCFRYHYRASNAWHARTAAWLGVVSVACYWLLLVAALDACYYAHAHRSLWQTVAWPVVHAVGGGGGTSAAAAPAPTRIGNEEAWYAAAAIIVSVFVWHAPAHICLSLVHAVCARTLLIGTMPPFAVAAAKRRRARQVRRQRDVGDAVPLRIVGRTQGGDNSGSSPPPGSSSGSAASTSFMQEYSLHTSDGVGGSRPPTPPPLSRMPPPTGDTYRGGVANGHSAADNYTALPMPAVTPTSTYGMLANATRLLRQGGRGKPVVYDTVDIATDSDDDDGDDDSVFDIDFVSANS